MYLARAKQVAALFSVALALSACGGPDIKQIARDNKFTKAERKALQVCYDNLMGKKPIITIGGEAKIMTDVPMDVCICHAKDMAAVYKPTKLESYSEFVRWSTSPKRKPLPKVFFGNTISGAKGDGAAIRLVSSLDTCATKFVDAQKNNEEYANLLAPLPVAELKKKKAAPVAENWSALE